MTLRSRPVEEWTSRPPGAGAAPTALTAGRGGASPGRSSPGYTAPCLLAIALLFSPAAARAAPATIGVFEAQVHAAPDASSPVIHTLPENARVSVSEEAVNGFRRVRLPE